MMFALPLFVIGFAEDCTQAIRPAIRLLVAVAAVIWMGIEADVLISQTDIAMIDAVLENKILAIAFTAFAIAGFSHALNIIDGLNGLASGIGVVLFSGIAWLANTAGDTLVVDLALAGVFALLGFGLLNFPRGRLFMGDGGAYFIGFWLAACATLLAMKPTISAWQMLAICAYPVIETLVSMGRRMAHHRPVAAPDRLHLHTLMYRRTFLQRARRRGLAPWHAHAMTSLALVGVNIAFVLAAINLGGSPTAGAVVFAGELGVYLMLYRRMVRFCWL